MCARDVYGSKPEDKIDSIRLGVTACFDYHHMQMLLIVIATFEKCLGEFLRWLLALGRPAERVGTIVRDGWVMMYELR